VDPAITGPEEDLVRSYTTQVSSEKYWQGAFRYPVDGSVEDDTIGFMSTYGNRRSYNGSDYTYFHTGLDFGVYTNSLNIYAAEAGVVVYTGSLTVRGNATFIDHGQGVFSGYFHQAQILVNVGDHVEKGQLIGQIGSTGRVTGPHLHWEIWVNGVQVNPVDWVLNTYP
jgi:murein DD-endopeptidase MepM/ murein hydrolase activator NlpD